MKKIASVLLALLMLSAPLCFSVSAENSGEIRLISTSVERFEDGSYTVTTLWEEIPAGVAPNAVTSTKTGSKTKEWYDSDGEVLWSFTLHGTFTYGSGTSSCTGASYTHSEPGSGWSLDSASTRKSGNTAYGDAEFVKKFLFITVDSATVSLTLSCSPTGVLS